MAVIVELVIFGRHLGRHLG